MTGIITGDLINSRSLAPGKWVRVLEGVLNDYGSSPKQWEIFRGDSFQLEVGAEDIFKVAITIKAYIKGVDLLDVRMGLGIGTKDYASSRITSSNGSAFINSGECFDALKKRTIAVRTPWTDLNEQVNLSLDLASLTMDNWTVTSASTMVPLLKDSSLNQEALAIQLNRSQSNVSGALRRAGFKEIMNLERYFRKEVNKKILG